MRDSLSSLRSLDSSTLEENLRSDGVHRLVDADLVEEFVVKLVSCSENFDVVYVMAIDGGHHHAAVGHLPGEDLVTKEVVSENS